MIAHPSFHNINFRQAEKMMESMDQGDVVIRPSSKGENHLTVTWKVRPLGRQAGRQADTQQVDLAD